MIGWSGHWVDRKMKWGWEGWLLLCGVGGVQVGIFVAGLDHSGVCRIGFHR